MNVLIKLVYNVFKEPLLILHNGLDDIKIILNEGDVKDMSIIFENLRKKENENLSKD